MYIFTGDHRLGLEKEWTCGEKWDQLVLNRSLH